MASVWAEMVPPPNADRPNDGQVKISIDVGPIGCIGYEVVDRPVSNFGVSETVDGGQAGSGGGGDAPYAQRLKSNRILRILERTLLIGGAMDAEALCIQSGTWVWRLHVDVSLLDDGGNAIDACMLAAVAALRHYRLPEVTIGASDSGDGVGESHHGYQETTIIHSDDREPAPLPLHHTPLTATFALFADDTGTTTSVSALLDPFDREELACDGLLTWSYNKYGEMCCLDFPGGCELRPRQLMSSAKLGKRRCVEICELLETALQEAEEKAQKERMERLKMLNSYHSSTMKDTEIKSSYLDMMDVDLPSHQEDQGDAATCKEEEEYRKRALDYSSGHVAASVKEDKEKNASKNVRGATSSLFNALLRSAQSCSTDALGSEREVATSVNNNAQPKSQKEPFVEIIAHEGKSVSKVNDIKPEKKEDVAPHRSEVVESDEEEVVMLNFSTVPREETANSKVPMGTGSDENSPENSLAKNVHAMSSDARQSDRKNTADTSKSKSVQEEDITDLSQAMKKKKKSKKSKKKK